MNIKVFIKLFSAVLVAVLSFACSECEDCDTPYEGPYVEVKFLNYSYLSVVEDSLYTVESKLENIELLLGLIDESQEALRDSLEEEKEALVMAQDSLTDIVNIIEEGSIRVDSLYDPGSATKLTFEDSASAYFFPLNMHADTATFYVVINDQRDTLTLAYQREIYESLHTIKMKAYIDSSGTGHSYQAVSIYCKTPECISNEAKIHITL